MTRAVKIAVVILVVGVVVGMFYLRGLRQRVPTGEGQQADERARRQVIQPPAETAATPSVRARIFWASTSQNGVLEPVEVELPLSADPAQRAKQLLNALIVDAPSARQRTLPLELTVLEVYVLADGSAVADFSHALATATPSGIASEQMAVDSIARTLEANLPQLRRLKILIQGQEADTVAGHIDLSGWLELRAPQQPR